MLKCVLGLGDAQLNFVLATPLDALCDVCVKSQPEDHGCICARDQHGGCRRVEGLGVGRTGADFNIDGGPTIIHDGVSNARRRHESKINVLKTVGVVFECEEGDVEAPGDQKVSLDIDAVVIARLRAIGCADRSVVLTRTSRIRRFAHDGCDCGEVGLVCVAFLQRESDAGGSAPVVPLARKPGHHPEDVGPSVGLDACLRSDPYEVASNRDVTNDQPARVQADGLRAVGHDGINVIEIERELVELFAIEFDRIDSNSIDGATEPFARGQLDPVQSGTGFLPGFELVIGDDFLGWVGRRRFGGRARLANHRNQDQDKNELDQQ